MLTDNKVLVNKLRVLPALMCAQRKAEKTIPTEEDFIRSNIESFGNEIGQTTNWITSMFEVQSRFEKGSREYEVLDYRIRCGQLYQQNAIDKAKGIVCKPMPREWHDRHATHQISDPEKRKLYMDIVADKKPYFMRYIYPSLSKQYNMYIKNTNKNALREFGITVSELMSVPKSDLTNRQTEFLSYYNRKIPVGVGDCVMNKICRRFEQEFDSIMNRKDISKSFDYTFLKTEAEYSSAHFKAIKRLYTEYNQRLRSYSVFAARERIDKWDSNMYLSILNSEFRKECDEICPNKQTLCNIVLDMCYTKNSTKRFAWSMCGTEIIQNLLHNNDHIITFPTIDNDGDFEYSGERFTVKHKKYEVN